MKRSPSAFRSTPPSPRTASVTSVPAFCSGKTMPVGWNCTSSMSRRPTPRPGSELHRVARVLVAPGRRPPPDARVTAGSEDDGVGDDRPPASVVDAEPVRAEDAAVVHEQPGHVQVVAQSPRRARWRGGRARAGSPGRCSRLRSRSADTDAHRRTAAQPPVVLACKTCAVPDEIVDRVRRLAAQESRRQTGSDSQ